jgi:CheY-like chemotaxis protein
LRPPLQDQSEDYKLPESLKVLVAEDNPINQKLVRIILEQAGHEVVIAQNGIEAVQQATQSSFDFILMDMQMPLMGGEEATEKIRASEVHTNTHMPIIALTAHAMSGDREKYLQTGMDGYIEKPLKKKDFYKEISRVLLAQLRR